MYGHLHYSSLSPVGNKKCQSKSSLWDPTAFKRASACFHVNCLFKFTSYHMCTLQVNNHSCFCQRLICVKTVLYWDFQWKCSVVERNFSWQHRNILQVTTCSTANWTTVHTNPSEATHTMNEFNKGTLPTSFHQAAVVL